MSKSRVEAFSDGVIAILITIMVLELHAPEEADFHSLRDLAPIFLSYVLSFVFVGIYWSNHHHLLQAVHRVNGMVLWANLHLLFWLSLIPFTSAWMGENEFASAPVSAYGIVLLMAAFAYTILTRVLISSDHVDSDLARAVGSDRKGMVSLLFYIAGIPLAFPAPWLACGLYAAVAILWLIPDRRIERALARRDDAQHEAGAGHRH